MKGTSILSRFWPRIHHPLPRTPRQSKKLLNALTSSFRRQLDREHPTTPSDRVENDQSTIENPNSSAQATDKHLRAILDNPLFRITPSHHSNGLVQFDPNGPPKDPMAVFDELAAAGSVTPQSIIRCLKSQLALAGKSNPGDLRESMKASRAGSRVTSWWLSTDAEARRNMLLNYDVISALTKFMVAEGLQGRIMQWLRMLLEHDLGSPNGRVSESYVKYVFSRLLYRFLIAEKLYGRGLASAMETYNQVCRMCFEIAHRPHSELAPTSLLKSGGLLFYWVRVNEQNEAKNIPYPIYEEYMAYMSSVFPNKLITALAPLYHPTEPSPLPLLAFVKRIQHESRHLTEAKRNLLAKDGPIAIRLLNEQGASAEASRLSSTLQVLLEKEPSTEMTSKPSSHTSAREDYLLDRLQFAP